MLPSFTVGAVNSILIVPLNLLIIRKKVLEKSHWKKKPFHTGWSKGWSKLNSKLMKITRKNKFQKIVNKPTRIADNTRCNNNRADIVLHTNIIPSHVADHELATVTRWKEIKATIIKSFRGLANYDYQSLCQHILAKESPPGNFAKW